MMNDFRFTVDTDPMAREIQGVNRSVSAVGAAVTAMQVAVIASEHKAANDICASIDSGFYMLMRSRLSQRIAQFASIMNSRTGSMMETASAIDRTHQQMQGDFNRIKSRYIKVFDSLDRNLESRVRELDRPAMNLASKRFSVLSGRQCKEAPAALFYTSDNSNVALKASNARLKARVQDSIAELGEGARHIMSYDCMTRSILEERREPSDAFVPAVYSVVENLTVPNSYSLEVQTPVNLDPQAQTSIVQGVRRRQDVLDGASPQDVLAIRSAFIKKTFSSGANDRVTRTMMNLFDEAFGSKAPHEFLPSGNVSAAVSSVDAASSSGGAL